MAILTGLPTQETLGKLYRALAIRLSIGGCGSGIWDASCSPGKITILISEGISPKRLISSKIADRLL